MLTARNAFSLAWLLSARSTLFCRRTEAWSSWTCGSLFSKRCKSSLLPGKGRGNILSPVLPGEGWTEEVSGNWKPGLEAPIIWSYRMQRNMEEEALWLQRPPGCFPWERTSCVHLSLLSICPVNISCLCLWWWWNGVLYVYFKCVFPSKQGSTILFLFCVLPT